MKSKIYLIPLFIIGLFSCNNKNEVKITWCNYNDEVLLTSTVKKGETPVYSGATPKKESTTKYVYKFNGWDPKIEPAVKNIKYKAQYKEVEKCRTIYKNYDNKILLDVIVDIESFDKTGSSYNGYLPQKNNDGDTYYYFNGWDTHEEESEIKTYIFTSKFEPCLKDDDRDQDGVVDYLDPTPLDSTYNLSISYAHNAPMERATINNIKLNMNFEDMFISDVANTNDFNNEISKLGTILHCNGDITNGGIINFNDTIKPNFKYSNIYERFGFNENEIESYKLDGTYNVDKDDVTGAILAHKSIKSFKTKTTKDFIFINIDIKFKRETGWYSNFDIGIDDDVYYSKEGYEHDPSWNSSTSNNIKGSFISSSRLYNNKIKSYIDQYENPVIFLSGYSRGGAIANHIANILNNEYDKPIKLFTYTYGSPNTFYGDKEVDINQNIFNVINNDDVVPFIPISTWKDENGKCLYKHGKEIYFTMNEHESFYYNQTKLSYEYFEDGVNLISSLYSTTRKEIYTLKDSGFSESFTTLEAAQNYKSKYIEVLYQIGMSDLDIENYLPFKIEENSGYTLSNKNCLGSILKLMGKYMNGGIFKNYSLYFDMFTNFYPIFVKLVLNGLHSIKQISYPHYITTYFLGTIIK